MSVSRQPDVILTYEQLRNGMTQIIDLGKFDMELLVKVIKLFVL